MIELQSASEKKPAPAKAGVGRLGRGLLLGVIALVSAAASTGTVYIYRDGPPPGFSGGFGEDHCQACHQPEPGGTINAAPGRLTIAAPARFRPGATYDLTITLARRGMKVGGFQLTVRFDADSAQAGELALMEGDQDRIRLYTDRGVQYAMHRQAGTSLTGPGIVRWKLRWTAPSDGRTVRFNVAANAANADETQEGDFIYTVSVQSRSR